MRGLYGTAPAEALGYGGMTGNLYNSWFGNANQGIGTGIDISSRVPTGFQQALGNIGGIAGLVGSGASALAGIGKIPGLSSLGGLFGGGGKVPAGNGTVPGYNWGGFNGDNWQDPV
jgi:hypothetical protein